MDFSCSALLVGFRLANEKRIKDREERASDSEEMF